MLVAARSLLRCRSLSSLSVSRHLHTTPSQSEQGGSLTSYQQLKKSFWPADRPHIRRKVVAVGGLIVASKLANTSVPLIFREIIDYFNVPLDVEHIPQLVILSGTTVASWVLIYGAMRALSPSLNEYKNAVFSVVAQSNIRTVSQRTYDHLLDLDLSFHQNRKTGQLSRVIDRGTRGADSILRALVVNVVPTVLELCLVLGVLWASVGFEYTAICCLTTASYIAFTYSVTVWRTQFRKMMNKADNEIGFKSFDTLINYETVKYFNNEKYEGDNYSKLLAKFEQGSLKTQSSLSLLNSGQQIIITLGITASMYLAVNQILSGNMSVGDLVMINLLLIQVAQPLNFLGSIYRDIQQSHTDMRKLNELLSNSPGMQDSPDAVAAAEPCKGDIVFDNISFGYTPGKMILKDLSFTVPSGKTVAIVGGSGSGKSTIVRLLYRFYDPNSGDINIGGVSLKSLQLEDYRRNVGVVPQDCVLFNDNIRYNIQYGDTSASEEDIVKAAKLADIHHAIGTFPEGYNTLVGERGQMLSGGEKQRIALARAVLKNAPILLYDEATSSLDSLTEHNILESLHTVSAGKTSIFIAHRLSTIMDADQILVLQDGAIAERGTHKQLLNNPESMYSEMWNQQMANDQ
ncbi:iron-sulfur clusters transporter ABCB7, mitochondrial-like [Bolinopsis microptera]|uniref:iron-sulfur clusters transporter ABCB7, mitochondrial-like n=1 Tax=Bolinopsis microptera TaxID=2820187 RepID=UPI00307AC411